jgi:hypothetical protein
MASLTISPGRNPMDQANATPAHRDWDAIVIGAGLGGLTSAA